MTDQETGAPGAAELPKTDFVLSDDKPQVEAADVQKPEPEPKKAQVEDHDEAETDQDEDSDHSEGKKRRRGGFQKKISRLEAENAALRAGQQPKAEILAKPENVTDAEPTPDKFTTYEDFTKALAEFQTKKVLKEADDAKAKKSREEAETAEFKAKLDKYQEGVNAVREANPDFDEAMAEFDDVPINPAIRAALVQSDTMGAEIAYYLSKHPDQFAALNQQNVGYVQVMHAFGKIEARIEASKPSPAEKAVVKTTSAPPPIKPVAKGKSAGVGYSEDMSFEDFQAWERKQKTR